MKTIAISGKGGTGKSTISTMIIKWLSENISKSILAVDADSNVNLNDLLGVEVNQTIGAIREEMKDKVSNLPNGMTKQQFLDYKIQTGLIETKFYDLIAMGCPEGPGCYCYSNNLLRDILETLSNNYDYVVIDNEAGMEHLSRRTTQSIDYLLIISDPTFRSVQAACKISKLVKNLDTRVKEKYLVLNRFGNPLTTEVQKLIDSDGLNVLCTLPKDEKLLEMEYHGAPLWEIASGLESYSHIDKMMRKLLRLNYIK
jgi:CO dehydrogenase maturation factor